MTKLSAAKLYARLLVDEWWHRYGFRGHEYFEFLGKQAKHGDTYCPYNLALKQIGA